MNEREPLPADFLAHVRALEDAYLLHNDPILQSGFHGGPTRWRSEREPILEAVTGDGDLLDVGCANGYLLECLVAWAKVRGVELVPYGVDIGPRLVAEARRRLPQCAANFWVGNAWDWRPPRRFRYVYTLSDCVPQGLLSPYVERLLEEAVGPGGRLIVGSYGSRSRQEPPIAVGNKLWSFGLPVAGESSGGRPPVTAFAWVDKGQSRGRSHEYG